MVIVTSVTKRETCRDIVNGPSDRTAVCKDRLSRWTSRHISAGAATTAMSECLASLDREGGMGSS